MIAILVVVLVVAAAVLPLLVYNRLVHLRNVTHESWRDIDTELQRRYDLVPNLVETVKGYAAHERTTFEAVTTQRAEAMAAPPDPDQRAPREEALGQGLTHLLALGERYPELRADTQFLALQQRLTDTEDRIQVSRRIYNANVRAYDNLVQTFPALLVARTCGFTTRPFFELDPSVRDAGPPPVDLSGRT